MWLGPAGEPFDRDLLAVTVKSEPGADGLPRGYHTIEDSDKSELTDAPTAGNFCGSNIGRQEG